MPRTVVHLAAATGAVFTLACAGSDNPVALADLHPQAVFEVSTTRVETLDEFEIHVHLTEGGEAMGLREGILEIEHEASGQMQEVPVALAQGEYEAHVILFEEGKYHIHFHGTPEGHRLRMELGEMVLEAHRQGRQVGPYWVELDLDPARVTAGESAHVHLMAFDGPPPGGSPMAGLAFEAELHDPDGVHYDMAVMDEGAGGYETEHRFQLAGSYELHVRLIGGAAGDEAEFHIPIFGIDPDADDPNGGGGGHGH